MVKQWDIFWCLFNFTSVLLKLKQHNNENKIEKKTEIGFGIESLKVDLARDELTFR